MHATVCAIQAVGERGTIRLASGTDVADVFARVEDDGPGMTADEIARATDPFFSTKASGTGLGLAITRQILEDHHGSLEMTSPPTGGTLVVMTIPDTREMR